MTLRTIEGYRERNEDAPLDLVRQSEDWTPVVRLINGWAREKLGEHSGYSPQELDHWSRTLGVRFPPVLREWWRLAGRHPFVEPGCSRQFEIPHASRRATGQQRIARYRSG